VLRNTALIVTIFGLTSLTAACSSHAPAVQVALTPPIASGAPSQSDAPAATHLGVVAGAPLGLAGQVRAGPWRPVGLPGAGAQAISIAASSSSAFYVGGAVLGPDGAPQAVIWSLGPKSVTARRELLVGYPGREPPRAVGMISVNGNRGLAIEGGGGPNAWIRANSGPWRPLALTPGTELHAITTDGTAAWALGSVKSRPVFLRIDVRGHVVTRAAAGLTPAAAASGSLLVLPGGRLLVSGGSPGLSATSDDNGATWRGSNALAAQEESLVAPMPGGGICALSSSPTRTPQERAYTSGDGIAWTPIGGVGTRPLLNVDTLTGNSGAIIASGRDGHDNVRVWSSRDCRTWLSIGPASAANPLPPIAVATSAAYAAVASRPGNIAQVLIAALHS